MHPALGLQWYGSVFLASPIDSPIATYSTVARSPGATGSTEALTWCDVMHPKSEKAVPCVLVVVRIFRRSLWLAHGVKFSTDLTRRCVAGRPH